MPQVSPGLEVFSLNESFLPLLSPCSRYVIDQEDTPIAQFQTQFFISHHLQKKNCNKKFTHSLFFILNNFLPPAKISVLWQ